MNTRIAVKLATAIVLALGTAICSAKNLYVAQNPAGGDTGADCPNAHGAMWFNTAGNWGVGAEKISAGDTVHLCGTFTGAGGATMLTTQGNGSAGSPVTIRFETGAVFTSPYWGNASNGAINISNNYITLDGGTNGEIRNTSNGTPGGACYGGGCSQQQASTGVYALGSNVTIQNLKVSRIYVKTEGTNDALGDANAGIFVCGSNVSVTRNVVDNTYTGIVLGCTDVASVDFSFNTLTFCNHCLKVGINSGTVTGVKMYDNDISSMYNWDQPDNRYHHNGIMTFADPAGSIVDGMYYNNYIHGMNSRDEVYGASHITALIFLEYSNPGAKVFNNVLQLDNDAGATRLNYPANAYISAGGNATGTTYVFNNTIIGGNNGGTCFGYGGGGAQDFRNNILVNCGHAIVNGITASPFTCDNNIYYLGNDAGWSNGGGYPTSNFATWKASAGCGGCDTNSQLGADPKLTPSYQLSRGSSAIGKGANLTGLALAPLNYDKAGATRPSTGAWDVGAFQFSSLGSSSVAAPTLLNVKVK